MVITPMLPVLMLSQAAEARAKCERATKRVLQECSAAEVDALNNNAESDSEGGQGKDLPAEVVATPAHKLAVATLAAELAVEVVGMKTPVNPNPIPMIWKKTKMKILKRTPALDSGARSTAP